VRVSDIPRLGASDGPSTVQARFPAPPIRIVGSDDASQGRKPTRTHGWGRESRILGAALRCRRNPRRPAHSLSRTSPEATRSSVPALGSADRLRDRGARESLRPRSGPRSLPPSAGGHRNRGTPICQTRKLGGEDLPTENGGGAHRQRFPAERAARLTPQRRGRRAKRIRSRPAPRLTARPQAHKPPRRQAPSPRFACSPRSTRGPYPRDNSRAARRRRGR
jgi:hypothetical protein